jgi:hypothetical protein
MWLEKSKLIVKFHKTVEKTRHNAWHDFYIKTKSFAKGDLVFLYGIST